MRDAALVLTVVGTDHHPFDRLVRWVDDWLAADADGSTRWLVQYGTSMPPRHAEGHDYVSHDELERLIAASAAVVCHGGPGTIMDARRCGHVPIVVPRDPAAGEHVDDHQVRFARRLAATGQIRLAEDHGSFRAAVREALASPRRIARSPVQTGPPLDRFRQLVDRLLEERPRPRQGRLVGKGHHHAA